MTFLYFAILVSCVCVCVFFCGAIVKDDHMTTATVSWGAECWQKLRICSGVPVRGMVVSRRDWEKRCFVEKGFTQVHPATIFKKLEVTNS